MAAPTNILVIDPQPTSKVKSLLEESDRIIISVKTMTMAKHALTTTLFSVVICDVMLPGFDPKAFFAISKCMNPNVIMIFMGPALAENKVKSFMQDGYAVKFLAKPFSPITLKKMVFESIVAYQNNLKAGSEGLQKVVIKPKVTQKISSSAEEGLGRKTMRMGKEMLGPDPTRYRIVDLIGSGGTGSVFLARDIFLDMDVAIKVINPDLLTDTEVLSSFKDEARITMQLSHTGILRMYNCSTYHGCYYVVMEIISGNTLREIIAANGPMSPSNVISILLGCASPIDYAHSHNVIHNDLKPENIVITDLEEIKIIDFGTASLRNKVKEITHIVGTPEYMSPEQLRGDIVGPQGDVYAMGIITYMMLTACFPYPPNMTADDFFRGLRPNFTGLPLEVVEILEKATHINQYERYETVEEMTRDLARVYGIDL